jgi:two-component system chemotaxis response regulator CheY
MHACCSAGPRPAPPEAGFEAFITLMPDIVLADWSPSCDGLALLNRIRQDPASANCFAPVIITSAYTGEGDVVTARDGGISEFLAKSVSARTLYKRIARIVCESQPFVRADHFFGPDRRRRAIDLGHPDRRVSLHMAKDVTAGAPA